VLTSAIAIAVVVREAVFGTANQKKRGWQCHRRQPKNINNDVKEIAVMENSSQPS
jgi:hypothetical protein